MQTPGLQTTRMWTTAELEKFRSHGYEWIQYQAQNGLWVGGPGLGPAKQVGLRAEVWGVTYNQVDFFTNGKALGERAVALGAQGVTMNAEMCAKFTRSSRGLRRIIEGVLAGGWKGPVNLSTLGSPIDPERHDFEMDTASFLETGGSIFVQAYVNAYPEYHPVNCVKYWLRFVPKERLNLTIGLYDPWSESGRPQLRGADYVPMLKDAGVGRAVSVFMPETMFPNDLKELEPITLPPPAPAPTTDIAKNRIDALALLKASVDQWRTNGVKEDVVQMQRQTLAWRVLHVKQTAQNLNALRDLLDNAEAPRP